MPEPGELLSAFDKDCNYLHLSQEYIQDLLTAKVSDDRVAIIIPPPAKSPKEIQALAAVMEAATKRRWRQYRRAGETKRLTDSEYVAQETLLADIQLYAARRVEELAKKYVRTGPDRSKNDLALFTDECKSLVLELWKERRDAFDLPLPYAMYEFSLLNESRYVALLQGGRSLESKLRLPFGFPTLQERIDWHVRRFGASAWSRHSSGKNHTCQSGIGQCNATAGPNAGRMRGYRLEVKAWMKKNRIASQREAARRLGVGIDILKSIMTSKGRVRHGPETLAAVLKKLS